MINIFIGIVVFTIGFWYLLQDWYMYKYMLIVVFSSLMVVLGIIAFMSGLRYPQKNNYIIVENNRDLTIDILRGLAVITMVAANMAAYVLLQPHPFSFRFYGTFAAPIFVLLSGMMVVYSTEIKERDLGYFLTKGRLIIIIAVLIDVLIWNIYPFTTMDVLYLIGVSIPLAFLFQKLVDWQRWTIVISIFILTPMLQQLFGYTTYPTEYYLWGQPTVQVINQTSIVNHWFIDGYFPIFPWLGFVFLGVNFGIKRWRDNKEKISFGNKRFLLTAIITLAVGVFIWWLYPGDLLTRVGFSELFYPPTIGFIITAIGLIMLLFSIIDVEPRLFLYKVLRLLGESSLSIYLLHLIILRYVIAPYFSNRTFLVFLFIYIIFSTLLIFVAYRLRDLKKTWKKRPRIVNFLFSE